MRVLLFGGSGFLGKALQKELDDNNIKNYTVSRSNKDSDYNVDIGNYEDFNSLPNDFFTVVVNCATVLPGGDYLDTSYLDRIYKTNILGSQNICNWIATQKTVKKIVNCSTLVVVKKPWNVPLEEHDNATYPDGKHVLYSSSKLTQELIFKTFATIENIELAQIRFSSLYGKNMNWSGLICNLIDQVKINNTIAITNGTKISADFLYIDDAAKIILAAIQNNFNGILNGASGVEKTILQVAETIRQNFDHSKKIENIENNEVFIDRSAVSVRKLNEIINTNDFVSLEEGIKKMLS